MTGLPAMTLDRVLTSVRQAGVVLWREGDQLRYRAEAGALTPELRQRLLERKSEILEFLREAEGRRHAPPLRSVARGGSLPLSFAQQRLWVLDQFEPNNAAYNIPVALRLEGKLDAASLQRCLNEIVRRHEALRTCFKTTVEGEPFQAIAPAASVEMPRVDLAGLQESEREETAKRLCVEEAQRPFNLAQDVMLRARLIRLGEADHILLLTMHHIASDGWSLGVLNHELAALYEAFVEGKPSPLPELPVQYADFATWQREWLQGEALDTQLAYWRKKLKGAPATLELPTDRPRPAVHSYRGATLTVELPKPLASALKELSLSEGATLFMTLLAAFQTLLHRYSGSDQIVVGTPIAGREQPELESLIGFFVNTLVLRGDLSGDPKFRALLARTRDTALEAYAHPDLPFERLVEDLHPDRSASRTPLFQALFALHNGVEEEPLALAGLEVASVGIETGVSKFDLTFHAWEADGRLGITCEYCTDLFEPATIGRMLGNFQTLLEGIVSDPDARLSDLPLLTDAERHQVLYAWNQTAAAFPTDRCLHDLIKEQAARAPDAIAVVFEGEQLTYRQLNERANQLASYLQGRGVRRNMLVAICAERSLEMVVGLLGILKAGGAYVPLDPSFPSERLAFMLRDSSALLVLTQQRLRGQLEAASPNAVVVCLDADWETIAGSPTANTNSDAGPEDLAYVIYTSGSTGQPKGVEIRHRNLINVLCAMRKRPGFANNDKLLAVTTISFDIAALELFLPLIAGGQVELAPASELRDGFMLRRRLELSGANVMQATPATWSLLIAAGWSGNGALRALCGGEALTAALANELLARAKELWNVYGPTETTIWSSLDSVRPNQPITVGRPIANTQFYVVDGRCRPVPIGATGELLVGGDGLARGYHNRRELTAERFIANPFSHEPGSRLYKTGDLVRYLHDGFVEYLGRLDHQVKIRGFRIELGEIEAVLAGLPEVRETVVLAREDIAGDKRLVAYLTAKAGLTPTDPELRALLRAKLPEYMVPSAFVVLDSLPLTPNRKVDRKALPRPELQSSKPSQFDPPVTEMQRALAEIWRQALGTDNVGLHDNFFDFGGHSLTMVRVVHKINAVLDVRLAVVDLLQNPTIAELAAIIEARRSKERQQTDCVFQLRRGEAEKPLYFIYAGPDEQRTAELIGGNRPVYGIQIPWPMEWLRAGMNEPGASFPDLEQFAGPFVEALHNHLGLGPCVLAGHCFAGLIAFEAARQFERRGGKVEAVVVIDQWARWPGIRRIALDNLIGCWSKTHSGLERLAGADAASRAKRSVLILSWLVRRELSRIRAAVAPSLGELTTTFDVEGAPVRMGLLERLYNQMQRGYEPQPLNCRGIIIRTAFMDNHNAVRSPDEKLGWGGLFNEGVATLELSGDHISIVRKETQSLASAITEAIAVH